MRSSRREKIAACRPSRPAWRGTKSCSEPSTSVSASSRSRFQHLAEEELAFICECADETCVQRVSLKISQYDDVRAIPARFVVAPGHEATPLVERVIFRSSEFVIVRKIGLAADVARELTKPQ